MREKERFIINRERERDGERYLLDNQRDRDRERDREKEGGIIN